MQHSIDPKPIGAFIEYTLYPILDRSLELVDKLESHNVPIKDVLKASVRLYIIDKLTMFFTQILTTGIICYTIYLILLHYQGTSM